METESFFSCKPLGSDHIDDYFILTDKIGAGASGVVHKAHVTALGHSVIGGDLPDIVAVKAVDIRYMTPDEREILRNEISVMKIVRLPRVVQYFGCFETQHSVYIITEWIRGDDLFELISKNALSVSQKQAVTRELAYAIKELHDTDMVHRDIKPENIMVRLGRSGAEEGEAHVTLVDLGFAFDRHRASHLSQLNVGTPAYRDPKSVPGDYVSLRLADWWSFAQTVAVMYLRKLLYNEHTKTFRSASIPELRATGVPETQVKTLALLTFPPNGQTDRPGEDYIFKLFTAT